MPKVGLLALCLSLTASLAHAEPTRIMVRALAVDAKFIGDSMGGVEISLFNARSGALLAKGLVRGTTGDTERIMHQPMNRGPAMSDAKTAGFEATVDLNEPTLVRVEAVGPLGKPAATIKVSSTHWVAPGRHVTGDGWILSFPGLVVEPTAVAADGRLTATAKISPMCGCPIEAGGLWDAANYEVQATLLQGDRVVAALPLQFTGQTGQFSSTVDAPAPGAYRLRVLATDRKSVNSGVADIAVQVASRR